MLMRWCTSWFCIYRILVMKSWITNYKWFGWIFYGVLVVTLIETLFIFFSELFIVEHFSCKIYYFIRQKTGTCNNVQWNTKHIYVCFFFLYSNNRLYMYATYKYKIYIYWIKPNRYQCRNEWKDKNIKSQWLNIHFPLWLGYYELNGSVEMKSFTHIREK